ncbi:MAG: CoA ester lyase [Deltaproteobacteria bacterium]|nr:CoA ester lyase [Deltaproteobacteria bacterium]
MTLRHTEHAPEGRPFRLLRSMLFVPANRERFILKAAEGDADGIILDLEDSVAPAAKQGALQEAVRALQQIHWGERTLAVRINGLESGRTYKDLIALGAECPRLDLIILPMVESPDHIRFAATLLDQVERGLSRKHPIGMEAIIETPLGLERIGKIARSASRLEALSFGAGDYAAAMHMRNRVIGGADPEYALHPTSGGAPVPADKWHWPMARLANACHAHGLRPRDSAYADFKDETGFRSACRRAAALGFQGKSAIHPVQVALCNEVFSPTPDEVAWAREVLGVLEASEREGQASATLNGGMVDLANARMAKHILTMTQAISERLNLR